MTDLVITHDSPCGIRKCRKPQVDINLRPFLLGDFLALFDCSLVHLILVLIATAIRFLPFFTRITDKNNNNNNDNKTGFFISDYTSTLYLWLYWSSKVISFVFNLRPTIADATGSPLLWASLTSSCMSPQSMAFATALRMTRMALETNSVFISTSCALYTSSSWKEGRNEGRRKEVKKGRGE